MTAAGDQRGPFLPSARQAMRYAVELASNLTPSAIDLERARVWVTIAHELRIGELPKGPFPRPFERGELAARADLETAGVLPRAHFGDESLLPVCEEVGPNDPEGALVVYDLRDVTCHACLRVVKERDLAEQIARADTPVARHAEAEAARDTTSYATIRTPLPENNYAGETASARVNRLSREALPEDTAVLEGPFPTCGHCGHSVELKLDQVPAIWIHALTRQAVCPVSNPDQTHSFATPLVDTRG